MLFEIVVYQVPIGRAAVLAPHGIHEKAHMVGWNAQLFEEAHEHYYSLGIDRRGIRPQTFDAYLVELALASKLRTLCTKHGTCI